MSIEPKRAVAYGVAGFFGLVATVVLIGILISYFTGAPADTANQAVQSAQRYVASKRQRRAPMPPSVREPTHNVPQAVQDLPGRGGRLVAHTPDGKRLALPSVKSDYDVDVRGDLATVTVKQRFNNPGEVPLNATYEFPLSKDAAVYEMIMRVGDEQVRAKIKKKEEARKTFEKAKRAGKAAALLEQHRPNMFTQDVANLMPGKPVDVTLRYVETVDKIDGRYQIVVPMVVGPRYNPADMSKNFLVKSDGPEKGIGGGEPSGSDAAQQHTTQAPPVSELDAPDTIDPERVSVHVRIDGGVPVHDIESASHAITATELDPRDWEVDLAKGRTIANKHFVLSYGLEGKDTDAGLLAYWDEHYREGYFSVLVEPPKKPAKEEIVPREMVFVLDCSGSMYGKPMDASKAYMRYALENLRPTDTFRIIRFSDSASEYTTEPQKATEANIEKATAYVESLSGMGGTAMTSGIKQALEVPVPKNTVRFVTFLTDGYIGNEYEIIRLIRKDIGHARLFALGVGSGVNRYLLDEMGHMGRGFTKYIDPTKNVDEQAHELAKRLQTPVLTDISVDWGKLAAKEITPERIPDLFAGQSVRIAGRYAKPGTYTIHVKGKSGSRAVSIPIKVTLPAKANDGKAVELAWARRTIKEYMHTLTTPDQLRTTELTDDQIKDIVTQMGLDYSLVTKWTSFVAVSEKVVNPHPNNAANGQVPANQVAGVSRKAYGPRASATPQFGAATAHGTPEPTVWGGLLVALVAGLMGVMGVRKRRVGAA